MNTEFKKISRGELAEMIEGFQSSCKILLTNFFGLSNDIEYEVLCGEKTILFRIPENDYFRLYILCADIPELVSFLKCIECECVINIPTKKSIEEWDNALIEGGFEYYTTYSHYLNMTIPSMEKKDTSTIVYAKLADVQQVYDLLYRNFPIYAAHLPSMSELEEMIKENRVIADYDKLGNVCGVNIYTITGTTAYGNGWVDEGDCGLGIFLDMFDVFVEKGVKRFVFWVRDDNKKVIKMHKMMGANPDGLKDYTYVKNAKKLRFC
jgi:disulfide oxidoreductase YuzD